jgi:hypothetical protein
MCDINTHLYRALLLLRFVPCLNRLWVLRALGAIVVLLHTLHTLHTTAVPYYTEVVGETETRLSTVSITS